MGTFLGCVGQPHIPEDRQEAFRRCILRLFREGGMMSSETVSMFGKNHPRDRRKFCVIDDPRQYENLRLSQE